MSTNNKKRPAEEIDDRKPRLTDLAKVDESTVTRLKKCVFFVEATREQRAALFSKFSRSADKRSQDAWARECQLKFDWLESGTSSFVRVGYIKGDPELPVTLDITIEKIDGKDVCFYYPSGTYADYNLIEEWLDLNLVTRMKNGRENRTNAENFHFLTTFITHGTDQLTLN
jgi:hypothetical protein